MTIKNFINPARIFIKTKEGKGTTLENYLNKRKIKKLWENPSPAESFEAQDITLSSDAYDYLIWIYKETKSGTLQMSQMSLKGNDCKLIDVNDDHASGTNAYYSAIYKRNITYNSDTSYSVATCNYKFYSQTSWLTTSVHNIPVAVYGGKF